MTRRTGFTLVELLVAVVLAALVAGAVTAMFSGGMRVWRRLQESGTRDRWVQVAFDQFQRDVHNLRHFTPIPFDGEYDAVSFPALVTMEAGHRAPGQSAPPPRAGGTESDGEELGQRGYFFDSARRQLCRSQSPYHDLRRARLRDACSSVLTDVDRVRFAYAAVNPGTTAAAWSDSWSSPEPPLAVKLEVSYHERAMQRPATYTLVVQVPMAATPKP